MKTLFFFFSYFLVLLLFLLCSQTVLELSGPCLSLLRARRGTVPDFLDISFGSPDFKEHQRQEW